MHTLSRIIYNYQLLIDFTSVEKSGIVSSLLSGLKSVNISKRNYK